MLTILYILAVVEIIWGGLILQPGMQLQHKGPILAGCVLIVGGIASIATGSWLGILGGFLLTWPIRAFFGDPSTAGGLHRAVIERNVEKARELLTLGEDVNRKDELGRTPLELAARLGDREMVHLLSAHSPKEETDDSYTEDDGEDDDDRQDDEDNNEGGDEKDTGTSGDQEDDEHSKTSVPPDMTADWDKSHSKVGQLAQLFAPSSDEPAGEQAADFDSSPVVLTGLVRPLPDCEEVPGSHGPFGECATNPVPVNGPRGECVYLSRLRSKNGVGFMWHRLGSVRTPVYPQPVDVYELVAVDAGEWRTLYFAMYHRRRSTKTPIGLSLVPWGQMKDIERVMCKIGFPGHSQRVDNFPTGLPAVIAQSETIREISPGVAKRLAQTVQKWIDERPGRWNRSPEITHDSAEREPVRVWVGAADDGKAITTFRVYRTRGGFRITMSDSSEKEEPYSAKGLTVYPSISAAYDATTAFFIQLVAVVWDAKIDALETHSVPELKHPRIVHIIELLPSDIGLPIGQVWIDDLDLVIVCHADPETRQKIQPPRCTTLATAKKG